MEQHPLFIKYRRDWLHEKTGYSKGYLSRVATGRIPLSRSFIERVCFKLKQPESELFLPNAVAESSEHKR
jgi:transcriptional regulator with XRE-family HTH domain